ncbi:MAG: ABC transporter substrate-binding protein [Candidatus Dehalobacter alkaniphilus]|uniref:ABC transporter substrate-binding protein n=1 Tax=Dehalobacter sp. DCM TaxID=2907827 RepID=UPI0030813538|nr:ABC transporter substrate-binding protein [Dehalobacter sp. DCM]
MKRVIKSISVLVIALLLAGMFTGCSGTEKAAKTSSDPATKGSVQMKVGTSKSPQAMIPYFYQQFLPEKYSSEVIYFSSISDSVNALMAGTLDATSCSMVNVISAASKGQPVVVLCGICNKCSALVAGVNSGIESEKDLKGKKIGYLPASAHHLLLLDVLRRNGLTQDDVTLVRLERETANDALKNGDIDAFMIGEPRPSQAVAGGYGKIISYPYFDDSVGTINAVMITTKENAEKNKDMIQDMVTAHCEATDYCNANVDVWQEKAAAELGFDPKVLKIAQSNTEIFYDITPEYIQQTKNLAQQMLDLKMITQIPNIEAMFDLSFLEEAEKEIKN